MTTAELLNVGEIKGKIVRAQDEQSLEWELSSNVRTKVSQDDTLDPTLSGGTKRTQ